MTAAPAAVSTPSLAAPAAAATLINPNAVSEAAAGADVKTDASSLAATAPAAETPEDSEASWDAPAPASTVAAPQPAAPQKVAALTQNEAAAPQAKPATGTGTPRDPVVNIETADSEMASAIAKARATLPEFWTKLEQPGAGESDFSLKVAIEGRNASEVEHFWLTGISRKDGEITGTISNDPSTVKTVRRGQIYVVNPDKISDWLYKRNGKMVGNETMRPLLKRLPAQQAASYREMYETP